MPAEAQSFLGSVWSAFESEQMRAVALRHYDLCAVSDRDYDVLIHPDDLKKSIKIIMTIAAEKGWRPLFRQQVSNHYHLGFWRDDSANAAGPRAIHLDLQDALGKKGFVYAQAEPFIAKREFRNGVRILQPEARAHADIILAPTPLKTRVHCSDSRS